MYNPLFSPLISVFSIRANRPVVKGKERAPSVLDAARLGYGCQTIHRVGSMQAKTGFYESNTGRKADSTPSETETITMPPITMPAIANPLPPSCLFLICDSATIDKITPIMEVIPQQNHPTMEHTNPATAKPFVFGCCTTGIYTGCIGLCCASTSSQGGCPLVAAPHTGQNAAFSSKPFPQ